jgi:hypothetical protein
MLHVIPRGRWCDIVVMNIHARTEHDIGSFYEELERAFDKFPKYHTNILLGDFNAKVGKEEIFKPTIGNESLHEISNDNVTSKYLEIKVQYSHIATFVDSFGRVQMETPQSD